MCCNCNIVEEHQPNQQEQAYTMQYAGALFSSFHIVNNGSVEIEG